MSERLGTSLWEDSERPTVDSHRVSRLIIAYAADSQLRSMTNPSLQLPASWSLRPNHRSHPAVMPEFCVDTAPRLEPTGGVSAAVSTEEGQRRSDRMNRVGLGRSQLIDHDINLAAGSKCSPVTVSVPGVPPLHATPVRTGPSGMVVVLSSGLEMATALAGTSARAARLTRANSRTNGQRTRERAIGFLPVRGHRGHLVVLVAALPGSVVGSPLASGQAPI